MSSDRQRTRRSNAHRAALVLALAVLAPSVSAREYEVASRQRARVPRDSAQDRVSAKKTGGEDIEAEKSARGTPETKSETSLGTPEPSDAATRESGVEANARKQPEKTPTRTTTEAEQDGPRKGAHLRGIEKETNTEFEGPGEGIPEGEDMKRSAMDGTWKDTGTKEPKSAPSDTAEVGATHEDEQAAEEEGTEAEDGEEEVRRDESVGGSKPGEEASKEPIVRKREEATDNPEERAIVLQEDWCSAIMLLGSIGFMMGSFYLTNHTDDKFRMHAWSVISATISIFSAVLLFQAVNGFVEGQLVAQKASTRIIVAFGHFFTWYTIFQLAVAKLTGAVKLECLTCFCRHLPLCGNVCVRHDPLKEPLLAAEDHESKVRREAEENLKCWATLLGHIVGFAAINAFSLSQQIYPDSFAYSVIVVFASLIVLKVLNKLTYTLRATLSVIDTDGDDDEEHEDEIEECGDDAIALVVSFLVIQVVRMLLTGELPDAQGGEVLQNPSKSVAQVFILVAIGWLNLCLQSLPCLVPSEGDALDGQGSKKQIYLITSFNFSWCMYFSADWFDQAHGGHTSGMMKQVYLACFLTILGMVGIWCVERQANRAGRRGMVFAMGSLIGFSWEKCFDIALTNVASRTEDPRVVKLMLAIVLVAVVTPAWRWYILPDLLDMEEAAKKEEEEEEHEDDGDLSDEGTESEENESVQDSRPKAASGGRDTEAAQRLPNSRRISTIGKNPEKLRRRIAELHRQLDEERTLRRKAEERAKDELVHTEKLQDMLDRYADEVDKLRHLAQLEMRGDSVSSPTSQIRMSP